MKKYLKYFVLFIAICFWVGALFLMFIPSVYWYSNPDLTYMELYQEIFNKPELWGSLLVGFLFVVIGGQFLELSKNIKK